MLGVLALAENINRVGQPNGSKKRILEIVVKTRADKQEVNRRRIWEDEPD